MYNLRVGGRVRQLHKIFWMIMKGWQPILQPRRIHSIGLILLCFQSRFYDAFIAHENTAEAFLAAEFQCCDVSPQLVHPIFDVCENVFDIPFRGQGGNLVGERALRGVNDIVQWNVKFCKRRLKYWGVK